MPELPEVERATELITAVGAGKNIERVETTEDLLVYSGTTHDEFATEITGRRLKRAGRYGKVFYLELEGNGRMPVLHFGMTGAIQVRGGPSMYYRKKPEKAEVWPPRFMKFILHLRDEVSDTVTQLAFVDARRLGRIRLCASPLTEAPISTLGFDPILSMPALENFKLSILKRSCPIKALLLDQSFSAGVGNYVADEILYHARVHPEQRCNTLTESQIVALHLQTSEVCRIAVEAKADDSKFPGNWLFKHRWGKGKKEKHTMTLPTGEPATIKWITVGGRTSAYVTELQHLTRPTRSGKAAEKSSGDESELTTLTESDTEETSKVAGQKRRMSAIKAPDERVTRRKTAKMQTERDQDFAM